jgi:hypothetical protein
VKLSTGQEQTLLATGPFTIRLGCQLVGAGETKASILIRTTEAGSLDFGEEFPPNKDRVLSSAIAPPGGRSTSFNGTQLLTPGGTALESGSVVMVNQLGVPCAGVQRLTP